MNTLQSMGSIFKTAIGLYTMLMVSCNIYQTPDEQGDPPPLYKSPQIVPLDIDDGYRFNQFTGESISPLLKPDGDTILSGKSVKITGKKLSTGAWKTLPLSDDISPLTASDFRKEKIRWKKKPLPFKKLKEINVPVLIPTAKAVSNPRVFESPEAIEAGKAVPARSSPYRIMNLDQNQGLNSSRILSIFPDSRGNMWLGTHSSGVVRYDGERFWHFTKEHGLCGNIIFDIVEDKNGVLWFGSFSSGISAFDGHAFTNYSEVNGLLNNRISAMLADDQNNLWIASASGLTKYDGSDFVHFSREEGLIDEHVTCLAKDHSGLLWIGTRGGGICSFDGKSFNHITEGDGLSSNYVLSLACDSDGGIWVGTAEHGVNYLYQDTIMQMESSLPIDGYSIKSILIMEDENSCILGTSEAGLIRYKRGEIEIISENEGLTNNSITALVDQAGLIWIATRDGGVNILDMHSFGYFTILDKIGAGQVRKVIQRSKGDYWMGTWGYGLLHYNDNKLVQFSTEQGLPSSIIWDIVLDNNELLWLGTGSAGLCNFDGDKFYRMATMESEPFPGIFSLLFDRQGNLWIGTNGSGLLLYDGQALTRYSIEEGFPGDILWSMMEDSGGNLWFATWGGGVSKFDGTYFTHYTEKEGLSSNDIWSIIEDESGNIWMGTYGSGAMIFSGDNFVYLTEDQGLSNGIVNSIIEHPKDHFWLGTEDGLNSVVKRSSHSQSQDNEPTYEFGRYTRATGLITPDFNVHSVYLDQTDRLWWGTGTMVVTRDNYQPSLPAIIQKVHVDELEVNGQSYNFRDSGDLAFLNIISEGAPSFLNLPINPKIPHRNNYLTFKFSKGSISSTADPLYSYKLVGLDKTWSIPSSENRAAYRNIPYGQYSFLVATAEQAGNWSAPAIYDFTILPPWWQTWWARSSYFMLTFFSVLGLIRWRTNALNKRRKELELTVKERTSQVLAEKQRSDELLLNILPVEVAEELKSDGKTTPVSFKEVSILFADFKEFTNIVASIPGEKLVSELDDIFQHFDDIMDVVGLEKIQTIGDAYVAAGGLPKPYPDHAIKCVKAAKMMLEYLDERNKQSSIKWKLRIGIHSGPITAGVVGKKKFTYDIFGDTVNIAARIESASETGRINISAYTHDLIKEQFACEYRGKINAKGKGDLDMYFVQ